jgi:hypothetical protein
VIAIICPFFYSGCGDLTSALSNKNTDKNRKKLGKLMFAGPYGFAPTSPTTALNSQSGKYASKISYNGAPCSVHPCKDRPKAATAGRYRIR